MSDTYGYSGQDPTASQGGYRTRLYNLLMKDTTMNFAFVGSQSSGPDSLGQKPNEGHSGYRIDEIAAGVDQWIAQYQHIGTTTANVASEQALAGQASDPTTSTLSFQLANSQTSKGKLFSPTQFRRTERVTLFWRVRGRSFSSVTSSHN